MRTTVLFALSTTLVGSALAVAPDGRPVRNSFVDRKVTSVADLVAHVRADSVVADRYERHFAMSRAGVLRFLSGLRRGRLAKAGTYTIYSVPKGGWLKMHVGRIPKGEPMFFDRAGKPTLVVKCGNPVTLGPQRRHLANTQPNLDEPEGARELLSLNPEMADSLVMMPSPLEPEILEPTVATATAVAVPSGVESVATVGASGVGSNLSWLGGLSLGFLPRLGSRSDSSFEIITPVGPPKQPVPEPASVVATGAGVLALARRRRR